MFISIDWIKEYVKADRWPDDKEFCDRMIMSGSNIETVHHLGTGIRGVKIGRVDRMEKHPHADHLLICQVNMGKETVQIVTGASNLFEGAYVPVCLEGSHIPGPLHGQVQQEGGVTIHKAVLRGVPSDGMLAGPQELGIPDKAAPLASKDGIWLLPSAEEAWLGQDLVATLGLADTVIDFEITPNRPDCLSMIGMAREAAATLGGTLLYPDRTYGVAEKKPGPDEKAEDYICVDVRSDLCKRYIARVIKNVRIGESPWWLQKKLIASGIRPINNIVDITNFVMTEYGQPLHAFDIRSLAGRTIVVDQASAGTVFTTLDGKERQLDDTMLMINDAEKPVALAGIMGGLNSEILPDTETVVLEAANFDPVSIRQTSKKMALRTEASSRYEKGISAELCKEAADRVCHLIEKMGCGQPLMGSWDVYPHPEERKTVKARVSRINRVLGTDLSRDTMVALLEALEMEVGGKDDDLLVRPPFVRLDLPEEVDFVEEVGRMYGYDKLPNTLPGPTKPAEKSPALMTRDKVREILIGLGMDEIITFSFISEKDFDACRLPLDSYERDTVSIMNPMGEDTKRMRTVLFPGLLDVLAHNQARQMEAVRCFEIGKVYEKNLLGPDHLPDETYHLSLGLFGPDEDFFSLKGLLEALLREVGLSNVLFRAEKEYGLFHPGRCARVLLPEGEGRERELGIMGEVHPDVAEAYGLEGRIYLAEFFMDPLVASSRHSIRYHKLPKYPSVSRDVALIVSESTPAAEVERVIREAAPHTLRKAELFDVYRGEQVEKGKKSMAYRLTYQDANKTLTDVDTDATHGGVLRALQEKLGALIRDK